MLLQCGLFGVGLIECVYGKDWYVSLLVVGNDFNNVGIDNDSQIWVMCVYWNLVVNDVVMVYLGVWVFYEEIVVGVSGVVCSLVIVGYFNDLVKIVLGILLGVECSMVYGVELVGIFGLVWVIGEWGMCNLCGVDVGGYYDLDYEVWVILVGWFLVGVRLVYLGKVGIWGWVKVVDFVIRGGVGVWELKGCYEDVDYVELFSGGIGYVWMLGVNWYFNDFSCVMFEVICWQICNCSGIGQGRDEGIIFNICLQVVFQQCMLFVC